jgi:DNA processing protein
MNDEYLFLFAQWNVFNTEQCRLILNRFGSFEAAWKGLTADDIRELNVHTQKADRVLEIRERISFEDMMTQVREFGVKVYFVDDSDYPDRLKQIDPPPPFLFVRGSLPDFHKSMAVVGTRSATDYGRNVTKRFTSDLARHGFVIVSGLATGIDSVAHQTTLELNGITVAVLGSGVDIISPSSNYRLGQQILQSGGAIVSAYPLGTQAQKHHFPERNAIISGLCQGTLVIEGGIHSGARHTAKSAHDQGREVFAIPNDVNKYALSLTNYLIRTSQAKLVENIAHIVEDLQLEVKNMHQELELSHDERVVMEKLASGGKTMDELAVETTFNIPRLSELILRLQLKNAIAEQSCQWVIT